MHYFDFTPEQLEHIWLISDTHFNHKNIIGYCDRPFADIEKMNSALIHNWNSVVGPNDIVIHLGDYALTSEAMAMTLLSALNGEKYLIKGNHDTKPLAYYGRVGFAECVHQAMLTLPDGRVILFTHRPESEPGDGEHYDLHFYGHVHDKGATANCPTIARNSACLCVERWNYTPVRLLDVVKMCDASGITASLKFEE